MPITSVRNIKRLLATQRFDGGGITATARAEITSMYESLWQLERQLGEACAYARETRQRNTKQLCKRHAEVKAQLDDLVRVCSLIVFANP